MGSTLACLGTSWRKSRVQYDRKHGSEVDEREDSGTQKFNSPQVKSIGCLLRCLRAVGRYWEEERRGRRELMRSRRRWRRSWSKRRRRWRRRRWEEEEGGCCSCIVGASPPPRSSPTPPHLHSNNFLFTSLPLLFPLIIWQQGFFGIKTALSISFWL